MYSIENIQAYYLYEYEKIQYSSYHWHQSRFDTDILLGKEDIEKLQFLIIDNSQWKCFKKTKENHSSKCRKILSQEECIL